MLRQIVDPGRPRFTAGANQEAPDHGELIPVASAKYRVRPIGEGWQVTGEGSPTEPFKRKLAAVRRAKTLARSAERGEVVIHGADGRVQTKHTYVKAHYCLPEG